MKPVIVVVTYNRPNSLKRLLNSLQNAVYESKGITLIISIDYQDSDDHNKVVRLSNEFDWVYGEKEIIEHKKNLGLKTHVLCCGDLVNKFNSIIMLEDDLFVSPYFYSYTQKALNFYEKNDNIGGVSLYNHKRNFLNNLPFELIPDSNDVYFLQIASSWGQSWTKNQWSGFREWLASEGGGEVLSDNVPKYIRNWPNSSWLKMYINYLVVTNKYFVFPTKSLTTNFGDSGTHNTHKNTDFQVPIFYGDKFKLIKFEDSFNVYDSYFEILPSSLKKLCSNFNAYDFTIDMYGLKPLNVINTKYIISSKNQLKGEKSILFFGLELKPMILNLLYNVEGSVFSLGEVSKFEDSVKIFNIENQNIFNYFIVKYSIKKHIKIFLSLIKSKIL
jgi:hypothetical protein